MNTNKHLKFMLQSNPRTSKFNKNMHSEYQHTGIICYKMPFVCL